VEEIVVLRSCHVKCSVKCSCSRRNLSHFESYSFIVIIIKQGDNLDKEIIQGTMPGVRARARPWMDNLSSWSGLSVGELIRKYTENVCSSCGPPVDQGTTTNQRPHTIKSNKTKRMLILSSLTTSDQFLDAVFSNETEALAARRPAAAKSAEDRRLPQLGHKAYS